MNPMFCDCCGDQVKAVYICRFVFHDKIERIFQICIECMDNGTLKIDLKRKRLVSKILSKVGSELWKKRADKA